MDSNVQYWPLLLFTILPALIVLGTAYYLMKQFFQRQYQLEALKLQSSRSKDTLLFKLQAHERLALFLERVSFPELILRIKTAGMEANDLHGALLVAIQQEYEHNLSQQVYVSQNLWKIIRLSKMELANLISQTYSELSHGANADDYVKLLLKAYTAWAPHPIETAKSANKQEANLLL